jgi:hypothetical protein
MRPATRAAGSRCTLFFLLVTEGCTADIARCVAPESARDTDPCSCVSVIDNCVRALNPHSSSSLDPRTASGKATRELLIASGAEPTPKSLPVAGGRPDSRIFP